MRYRGRGILTGRKYFIAEKFESWGLFLETAICLSSQTSHMVTGNPKRGQKVSYRGKRETESKAKLTHAFLAVRY